MDGTDRLPAGFHGPVEAFAALAPVREGAVVLRLPDRDRTLGTVDGGPFAAIEVRDFTESMGTIEAALRRCADLLEPDGTLVLDVENQQSPRQLRLVIEGRPGSFDPAGSLLDPSRPLPLRRLLQAAEAAGLGIDDVVRVPITGEERRPGFVAAAFDQGYLPFDWIGGPPPARFWLRCSRRRVLAGSVLIGAGSAAAQAVTRDCVRRFLPDDWEIVAASGTSEAAAWTAAVGRARGDLVWFLRAGAEPSHELFAGLSLLAGIGGAVPGDAEGQPRCPGDLSGAMLSRSTVLLAGPLATAANTQVVLEDYWMRLEATAGGGAVVAVPGAFASPPPPMEAPERFQREAEAMMARWAEISARRADDSAALAAKGSGRAPEAPPWQGRAPRVSLCMIARDEQRFLRECLERAAPAVDEIVLVDTGSTDDTVAIAEEFGARVVHQPWNDDFSAPRNRGLAEVTGDWVLVLDADEFLVPGAAERIRELVQDPAMVGYHMRFTNLYTGGKTLGVMMVRLFRNLPGIAWQNLIHEQITPSLVLAGHQRGLVLSSCDVEVEHHGYSDEVMDSRRKNERNERLFRRQLERQPDDVYCLYKYGDFLRRVPGRDEDAAALLERSLERILAGPPGLPRELPYAGEVAALCALLRTRAGDTAGAQAIVEEALRRFVPTPNLHYIAASLMLATGAPDAAIAHFRRCLSYRGQVLVVPIQDGITGHVSLLGIAQALAQKGQLERSQRLAEHAVALAPDYEVAHMVLSKVQLVRGDARAALQTLTNYLAAHPESAGACQQTTLVLQRLGCTDQARRMAARAVDLLRRGGQSREVARMEEILAAL
ncbi:MAG: glycosyltransferase [Planctomycetota bacterium]